jgi:hypothetical protein
MTDNNALKQWIMNRICEALDQANLARAAASDLGDHALVRATVQLAEDLESFALSLAVRLAEMGECPGSGGRVPGDRRPA